MNALPCHALGFGSLNLDEFWEVPLQFLSDYGIEVGREYVREVEWFLAVQPRLAETGVFKGADPGGSAANMIAALKKMGFRTGFIGAAGVNDADRLRLHELGQPSDLRIITSDVPAGRCLSLICREDPDKDRALIILPNANNLAGSVNAETDFISRFQWIHMTSFVSKDPLERQVKLAQDSAGSAFISFDPGRIYCALGMTILKPILELTEVLFLAEEELLLLTESDSLEQGVEALLRVGTRLIIVKKGARGISAFSRDWSAHRAAIRPDQLVDRTGAGDVCAAGFLAGRLIGLSIEECLDLAVMAAAASLAGYGRSAYPGKYFLDEYRKMSRS